jgi:outer membrane protein OmpA-like peptidoglycan-associated protein
LGPELGTAQLASVHRNVQNRTSDVDAIGAIGSALALSFDASVLFNFNESRLLSQAQAGSQEAVKRITAVAGAAVTVEGHTDNIGATKPAAVNTTEAGRQRNRRVEIVIVP